MTAKRLIGRTAIPCIAILVIIYLAFPKSWLQQEGKYEKRSVEWFTYDDPSDQPVASFFDILPSDASPKPSSSGKPEHSRPTDTLIDKFDFNKPVELQFEWASVNQNFTAEATRFLRLIQSSKPLCPNMLTISDLEFKVCNVMLSNFPVYSFNIDQKDPFEIEKKLLKNSADLQIFGHNPNAQLPVPDASDFSFEMVALDNVDSAKAKNRRWSRNTFATLRKKHNHNIISLVILSMNSAEWKILRNVLETGEVNRIAQLVVQLHLSWAGFGVSGDDAQVVHNWTEVVSGLAKAGFTLIHSAELPGPKMFLGQTDTFNSSSRYYLTFLRKDLLDSSVNL